MSTRLPALPVLAALGVLTVASTASGQLAPRPIQSELLKASAVGRWDGSRMVQFLDSCLTQPGNLTAGTEHAWEKAKYAWFNHPVSDADQMNGITQQGMIMIHIPIRTGSSGDWDGGVACFTYVRQRGISTIDLDESVYACMEANELSARNFVTDHFHGGHWPCHSQG